MTCARSRAQRTAIGNKLRWVLHQLDPELAVATRGLCRLCVELLEPRAHLTAVVVASVDADGPVVPVRALP